MVTSRDCLLAFILVLLGALAAPFVAFACDGEAGLGDSGIGAWFCWSDLIGLAVDLSLAPALRIVLSSSAALALFRLLRT